MMSGDEFYDDDVTSGLTDPPFPVASDDEFDRHPRTALRPALDAMARRLYGWTKAEAHAVLSCVRCRNTVDPVELSNADLREYELSGICPTCWRELFPPEDES